MPFEKTAHKDKATMRAWHCLLGLIFSLILIPSSASAERFPDFERLWKLYDRAARQGTVAEFLESVSFNRQEIGQLSALNSPPELLLVYQTDPIGEGPVALAKAVRIILKAEEQNRWTQTVLLFGAAHCLTQSATYCEQLEPDQLVKLDPDNIASYSVAASLAAKRGDFKNALALLQTGNTKERYDLHERALIDQMYATSTRLGFPDHIAKTNAYFHHMPLNVASSLVQINKLRIPKRHTAINAEVAKMARRIEQRSSSLLGHMLALGVQRSALAADKKSTLEVDQRLKRIQTLAQALSARPTGDVSQAQFDQLFDDLRNHGEITAQRKLYQSLASE